jgi:hypothetical protein
MNMLRLDDAIQLKIQKMIHDHTKRHGDPPTAIEIPQPMFSIMGIPIKFTDQENWTTTSAKSGVKIIHKFQGETK